MTISTMCKKDNKGFSLIELIIVIAIMAVLTAILTPQLIKYVERAREAKDRTNIESVYRAFQLAVLEPVSVSGGGINDKDPSKGAPITYYAAGYLHNIGTTLRDQLAEIYGPQGKVKPDEVALRPSTNVSQYYFLPPLTSKKYKNGVVFRFSYSGVSDGTGQGTGHIRVYCPPLD